MAGAKSIEALSLSFTAGALAGTMISAAASWSACAGLLTVSAIMLLLGRKLEINAVFLLVFMLLGSFCAINASMMPEVALTLPGAGQLRSLISGIPFSNSTTAPLLCALITGDRSGLSPETVNAFRASGASHILALSGLHIGIIYLIFDRLTRVIGRTPAARHIRFWTIVLGAGYFTLMTGAGPSIVRAFLFILINETLRLTGRPRNPVRVLCLALLVQLVLQPRVLSTIGFQLSYLAMAGVFILYPALERLYPESRSPLRWVWKSALLTISCQAFTAPLVWLRFHTFPRYFLLANLLALPLTTCLMTVALGTIFLAGTGICPSFAAAAADSLCSLLVWVLDTIASLG